MRMTFISMCAVLAATLGLCLASMAMHFGAIDELTLQCDKAMNAVQADDMAEAKRHVRSLEDGFDRRFDGLEFVADHDLLHEVLGCITDARVALECEDMDDAWQALEELKGSLDHIREHEGFSLANIF